MERQRGQVDFPHRGCGGGGSVEITVAVDAEARDAARLVRERGHCGLIGERVARRRVGRDGVEGGMPLVLHKAIRLAGERVVIEVIGNDKAIPVVV